MHYREKLESTAALIKNSAHTYILTGAGISTESGLPDFRSPGTGVWEKTDPMKTSTQQVLFENPRLFYEAGFARFAGMIDAEPNDGHYALAEMERLGLVRGIITQNIDGLHIKAGSKKVWEVHGHLRSCHCLGCSQPYHFQALVEQLQNGQNPPLCMDCGGMLRPDVVLFGDPMAESFFDAQSVLQRGCDLMMVVGSSLMVYPVASLPRLARKLAIVNLQPTSYDSRAEVVIREKCGKVLQDLLEILKQQ